MFRTARSHAHKRLSSKKLRCSTRTAAINSPQVAHKTVQKNIRHPKVMPQHSKRGDWDAKRHAHDRLTSRFRYQKRPQVMWLLCISYLKVACLIFGLTHADRGVEAEVSFSLTKSVFHQRVLSRPRLPKKSLLEGLGFSKTPRRADFQKSALLGGLENPKPSLSKTENLRV